MIRYTGAILLTILMINTYGQIPVEVFTGHQKTTVDIMFFNYFKNKQGENSRFLFFNRNRASVDYEQTTSTHLPQFGFTEAISYNDPKLKGLAPVAVVQLLNSGVYTKAGIQYVLIRKALTIFSWVVIETDTEPNVDLFLLVRYTPAINDRLKLFTQLESVNALPTEDNGTHNFIQRLRLGLKMKAWQAGIGSDFSQSGNSTFTKSNNIGIFLRYEF
jgi:hypothetical protein